MPGPAYRPAIFGARKGAPRPTVTGRGPNRTVTSPPYLKTAPEKQARKVKSAFKRVRRAYGSQKVSGPGISKGESKFYSTLAKKTGLSPRVLAAQGTQEGGADDDYNILNIGHTDSGPLSLTADKRFSRPKSAAKVTANFLKGKEYGASQGIKDILRSKGKPEGEQISAIARSGWATDPTYESKIRSIAPSIKAKPAKKPEPKDVKTLEKAGIDPKRVNVKQGEFPAKPVPQKLITRFKAAKKAAAGIDKERMPYQWGGGHVPGMVPKGQPLDCSGAVSAVLQRAGYKIPSMVSGQFESWGKPGPGALTIYANSGHVLMKIGNKFFGTSGSNPGGGAGWIDASDVSDEYLSGFTVRHAPGLGRKTAADLGVKVATAAGASASSAASLSGSAGGTGGTPSGTTKKAKKGAEAKRKLARVRSAYSDSSDIEPDLADLERRYSAAV